MNVWKVIAALIHFKDWKQTTLKSILEEQSILSKQGGILMKNDYANRAILREQSEHFQRNIKENRAK